jgi:ABC-2 type transport system ATP-binding protein
VKALVSKPRLLVLDEPLANLDVMGRQEFLTNLEAIATSFEQPVPILITSQHLYEIEAVADQMIILDGGTCVYSGPSRDIAKIVPDRRIEVTMRARQKAVEAALLPHGLTSIEATMEGFILGFPKSHSATALFELIGRTFPDRIVALRDITSSARSLFRDEVEDKPAKSPALAGE